MLPYPLFYGACRPSVCLITETISFFLTVTREDPSEERFGVGEDTATLPSAGLHFGKGCFLEG